MKCFNHSKGVIVSILFLLLISLFSSCSKDNEDDNSNNPPVEIKKGILKVTVNYIPNSSSIYAYYLKGQVRIRLLKDGQIIATQYSDGTVTLDFGTYEYGNYTITAYAIENRIRISTAQIEYYETHDITIDFIIDATTKTIEVEIS